MGRENEIMVLPFFGQGHLFPCMELCKHLASRNFHSTLVISSNLSSSVPSSLWDFPGVEVLLAEEAAVPVPPPPPAGVEPDMGGFRRHHQQMGAAIETLLSTRVTDSTRPVCAVLDNMMSWSKDIFQKFGVPTVAMFTSGACSAALEYGAWKSHVDDLKPGETRLIPGLPEEMGITYLETKRKARSRGPGGPPIGSSPPPSMMGPPGPFGGPGSSGPPIGPPGAGGPRGGPGGGKFGPPRPGHQPPWIDEVEGSMGLMINTCEELEGPFLKYLAEKIEKPVWGVGPLLPEGYWKSAGALLSDGKIRPKKQSNYSEEEVIQWLDCKPRGSVLYVSFGSEVGPTLEEYVQLADALAESEQPFIWVIQPNSGRPGPPAAFTGQKPDTEKQSEGYYPHGLDAKVGSRGLIIHGWAPQLLILSHPSTGGFLSHCGWNSTVEAIGRGIPFLAWPIRGDQFFDAKLVVCHLKIGYMVADDLSETVNKEDIKKGIVKLMSNKEKKTRAEKIGENLENGFPASSSAALDAFVNFLGRKD